MDQSIEYGVNMSKKISEVIGADTSDVDEDSEIDADTENDGDDADA